MSVSTSFPPIAIGQPILAGASPRNGAHQQARAAIGNALAQGDLSGAQAAFSQFAALSHADRASQHPNGAFAKLQSALQAGDLSAAQAAYQRLVSPNQGRVPVDGPAGPPVSTGGSTPSTPAASAFGSLGQNLNLSA